MGNTSINDRLSIQNIRHGLRNAIGHLIREFVNVLSLSTMVVIIKSCRWLVGLLRIYVALAVFQPYRDLEAGDNQSLKIQVARRGIEPRTSCSASQELNHSATAAPLSHVERSIVLKPKEYVIWRCVDKHIPRL